MKIVGNRGMDVSFARANSIIPAFTYWCDARLAPAGVDPQSMAGMEATRDGHEAAIGEDPDKRDYIVSNAKIEATGFQPNWSIDAGIAELIRGYRMLRNSRYSNL